MVIIKLYKLKAAICGLPDLPALIDIVCLDLYLNKRTGMKTIIIIATLVFSLNVYSIPNAYAAGVNKQQAASIAKAQYSGRIIDVKQIKVQGNLAYRVKILDQTGGVHIVIVDQATGDVLSAH